MGATKDVVVRDIKVVGNRVSANIVADRQYEIFYEYPSGIKISRRPADAFLVLSLPVAMALNRRLVIKGEVTNRLVDQLSTYQDILQKWYYDDGFRKIDISAETISGEYNKKKRGIYASTFTGGVDSFYTLLKNKKDIKRLFYIHGLDIKLEDEDFIKKVSRQLNKTARKLNIPLVEPVTNCKHFLEDYTEWRDVGYGPAIASTLLLASDDTSKFLIPGAEDYNFLAGGGTHLLINPLWSCNGVEFTYDGAEASRIEKVKYIVDDTNTKDSLRVCWRSNTEYNCGVCEKCIRTLTAISIVGNVKEYEHLFAGGKFNLSLITKTQLRNEAEKSMAMDSYRFAVSNNKYDIARRLKRQIEVYEKNKNNTNENRRTGVTKIIGILKGVSKNKPNHR